MLGMKGMIMAKLNILVWRKSSHSNEGIVRNHSIEFCTEGEQSAGHGPLIQEVAGCCGCLCAMLCS